LTYFHFLCMRLIHWCCFTWRCCCFFCPDAPFCRMKVWRGGPESHAQLPQVPGHLDFGISPMPGVPPQGRRGRRDAWGGGFRLTPSFRELRFRKKIEPKSARPYIVYTLPLRCSANLFGFPFKHI
jgi:hypothetical protein